MVAINLVDNLDSTICYGILICKNEKITGEIIQDKILEIKEKLFSVGEDWIVEDVIEYLPKEWSVTLQKQYKKIGI